MPRSIHGCFHLFFAFLAGPAVCEDSLPANRLQNPTFEVSAMADSDVTCWNAQSNQDTQVLGEARLEILAGKRVWQFATLMDLQVSNGDELSLLVTGFQHSKAALKMRLCLMLIESEGGTWTPKDFHCSDDRTFSQHGRGELIRSPQEETSSDKIDGSFELKIEGLTIDVSAIDQEVSSAEERNVVGVLVEFENTSSHPVWIRSPSLVQGNKARNASPSRDLPRLYRRIPRTLKKLSEGRSIHILALGSSIDRGSANPRMYLYDEDPASPNYKRPMADCRTTSPQEMKELLSENEHRPDLVGYIAWWQHYFCYSGRMRLELMRKFDLPVNRILLNLMALDGSSIGESHSGFPQWSDLQYDPDPGLNGHPNGKSWQELYPDLFADEESPAPDLVIFGHGHNEHIDRPDEVAAYEGAIRWFQSRYPDVEFVCCMWIRDTGKENSIDQPMEKLCAHYGIPFVQTGETINGLLETNNRYALMPDGGHPGAAAHYVWYKQLEKVFEVPAQTEPSLHQEHLPPRINEFSYGWEGDILPYEQGDSRIVDSRMMIIDDCSFNLWANDKTKQDKEGEKQPMNLLIDGEPAEHAGHGRHRWSKPNLRNSSFLHGRLSLGDRHLVELLGKEAMISFIHCKVCPDRTFVPAASFQSLSSKSASPPSIEGMKIEDHDSNWGAPYGSKAVRLRPGESISVELDASDLSVVYVDQVDGGELTVEVDGDVALKQPTDQPYRDSNDQSHFMENRRGIHGLKRQTHHVRLRATGDDVLVLGVYGYQR